MARPAITLGPWPEDSALADPVEWPTGAVLFRQGQSVRTLHYLVEGRVRLTVSRSGGREVLAGIRATGWLLGVSPAVLGNPYWSTGVAAEPCVVRALSAGTFVRLVDTNIAVARWVAWLLADDLRAHATAVAAFGGDAGTRLTWHLAEIARTQAIRLPDESIRLGLTTSREELGQAVGISREHLRRLLHRLQSDGLGVIRSGGRFSYAA